MNEIPDQEIVATSQPEIDREKLREERRVRNKQKKATKRAEKQKEREQQELLSRLRPKSNNVVLITRALADKMTGNAVTGSVNRNTVVNTADFPELGSNSKCKSSTPRTSTDGFINVNLVECVGASKEKKTNSKLELADFLCVRSTNTKPIKNVTEAVENYNGNMLDSDMPLRRRGKFREVPKIKRPSKLKQDILADQREVIEDGTITSLLVTQTCLCDHVITEELHELTEKFISTVVLLQEKLYQRDPLKGTAKRRYVVGFHEVKKYLNVNKVKILIVAADIKLLKPDDGGGLYKAVKQIVDLAKTNNVPYLFALKRRLLGVLTRKYIPVSCMGVLNYEGSEDHFSKIAKLLPQLREDRMVKPFTDDTHSKILENLMEGFKCQQPEPNDSGFQ